jgi:hypothetical protein
MTTTYYIGTLAITSSSSVGVLSERSTEADYWKVRIYVQDTLTNAMVSYLVTNKTSCSIKVSDGTGTVIFTGTVVSWESTTNYSFVNVVNCTCTKS